MARKCFWQFFAYLAVSVKKNTKIVREIKVAMFGARSLFFAEINNFKSQNLSFC